MKVLPVIIIVAVVIFITVLIVVLTTGKTPQQDEVDEPAVKEVVVKQSAWIYILGVITILAIVAVVLLLTRKVKPASMFEMVSLKKAKNIIVEQYCEDNNIAATTDADGNVTPIDESIKFKSKRAFYTPIGTKHAVLEAEIENGPESGLYVFRVPLSLGEEEIRNGFYDMLYHENIIGYTENIFSPRKFPVFSYKEAEEKLLQMMMTLDPDAVTQIRNKVQSLPSISGMNTPSPQAMPIQSEMHMEDYEGVGAMSPREMYEWEKWKTKERNRAKRQASRYRRR